MTRHACVPRRAPGRTTWRHFKCEEQGETKLMFKPKRIQEFPPSDRFQFLRLMKRFKDLAMRRNHTRFAAAANECLDRLTEGNESCPLSRIFIDDFIKTELSARLALIRSEELGSEGVTRPLELLDCLFSKVKLRAAACDDSKYLESVLACESFINNRDRTCPFHWIREGEINVENTSGPQSSSY